MSIVLKSCDGESFEVEEVVARESQIIEHVIEDTDADPFIPVPNVSSNILAKVIEYCEKHVETPMFEDEDLKNFDAEFVKVDQGTLFDLILAAHFLNIPSLQHLTGWTLADMIKGRNPDELRKTFNLKKDFTSEEKEEEKEEEEVRRETAWAFGWCITCCGKRQ